MKTLKNWKCRASQSGKLATNPRRKTDILSQTTISYLQDVAKEAIYGVKKSIDSKYIEKGLMLEDTAIDKAIEWLDLPFAIKNEKQFEDDYFTGEPDLILPDEVIDTKVSWDLWTFPLFDYKLPTADYYAQMQVYLHLTGLKKGRVVYVLLETPEELLWNETQDYSHIDPKYRIKDFSIDYDPEFIEMLQTRVIECRNYLKTIIL